MKKGKRSVLNVERFFQHFENCCDLVFITDEDGKYIDVNPAACQLLGYSKEEFLKMTIDDLAIGQEKDRYLEALNGLRKTGKSGIETILIKKDGNIIPVEMRAFTIFDGQYIFYCCIITKQKEVEKNLRETEHLFRMITNNMLDVITIIDLFGRIKYASPTYQNLLGYNPCSMLNKVFLEYIHPDDVVKVSTQIAEIIYKKISGKVECRFRNAKGSYIWLEIIGSVALNLEGRLEGGILCSRDIGERKFSEKMLIESENRYRRLVELLPNGILVISNGKIVFANKSANLLLGGSEAKSLIGRECTSIVHPDYISIYKDKFNWMGQETPLEVKYLKKDGEAIDVEITGTLIDYEHQPAELIVFKDITERKRSEASLEETRQNLFEKEKMAIIGQMAAGMAHEVRNPLTSVRGYAQLLKIKNYEKSQLDKYMDIIIGEIDRVNDLISEFLQLARPKKPNLEKHSINNLIKEFLELFIPYASLNNIEVISELEENLPLCLIDKSQIMQVLLNLGKNAVESMPTGGKMIIVSGFNPDTKQICFSIEDNGYGISEADLKKLAMPFFSTKEKGTGLGLTTSYAIIGDHGGNIKVESKVGKGARFTINLPENT